VAKYAFYLFTLDSQTYYKLSLEIEDLQIGDGQSISIFLFIEYINWE
jgi:hypothetical protein